MSSVISQNDFAFPISFIQLYIIQVTHYFLLQLRICFILRGHSSVSDLPQMSDKFILFSR